MKYRIINDKTMERYKLKAVRVPDFDMVGDQHYGDTPYGVCLDVYDIEDNFVECGTDWSYFATEEEAEKFLKQFNTDLDVIPY